MPSDTFFNLPEEKRNKLIHVAADAFAAASYEHVSMSQIARRAGIAKGSLYQYFADKCELYLYLVQLAADEKLAYLQRVEPPSSDMGMFPYLRWLTEQTLDFQFENPNLYQVAYRALYSDRPFPDQNLQGAKEAGIRYFETLIKQGMARGELRPDLDVEITALLISNFFSQIGDYVVTILGKETFDSTRSPLNQEAKNQIRQAIGTLLDLLERGIGAYNTTKQENLSDTRS